MTMNNYTLGRGELHFGKFRPNTQVPMGERYLGNTPEFNMTAEEETLNHYNSDRGVRIKDASVTLQVDYMSTIVCDNIDMDNLALFFLGEAMTHTVAAATGVTETFEDVKQGYSYQLGTSDASPSGARMVENVTVTGATAGTDYVLDAERGRITVLEGGGIEDGDDLAVEYDIQESSRPLTISRSDQVEGTVRFIARNAAGKNIDYFMPWVKITPNGDFSLKGDEWQQLSFNVEILKKGNLEAIYADGQAYVPTPVPGP